MRRYDHDPFLVADKDVAGKTATPPQAMGTWISLGWWMVLLVWAFMAAAYAGNPDAAMVGESR